MEPIRVLHILHSMNRGGAENAIMNYYRHIDRKKVQFDFLLTEPSKCQFEDEILSLGGRVFRVPLLTIKNPLPYLTGVWRFYKSHPEYRIVHSHTSSKSVFPLLIAKFTGIPIRICHSHGSRSEVGINGKIRNFLKPFLKTVATHFVACGHNAAEWLFGDHFLEKGKVVFFPNVIEASHFDYDEKVRGSIRRSFGIKDSTVVLGCTARFSTVKNHSFLLSLFKEFHNRMTDSVLLLVGDGELRDEIKVLISSLGIKDSVIMPGVVSNVSDYEQAMDFFLLPSIYEGFPITLVEAQTSGLHCLVSDSVTKDVNITGNVRFLSLKESPARWAEEAIELTNEPRVSCRELLTEKGYDVNQVVRNFEQLICS